MARLTTMVKKAIHPPGYVVASAFMSIGGFLNGHDTGCIGAVTEMPFFTSTFGALSPSLRGFTVSILMLAGAIPSFFAGQLADRFGRLAVIATGALVFLLGAVLQGAAFHLPMFIVGRAFSGLGEGLWMAAVSVYIAEIAPSSRRGMLASTPAFMAAFGVTSGYFTCYGSIHISSSLSWRLPYIIQALAALTLAVSCFLLPQSPRWLLFNGQREKAIAELGRLDFSAVEAEKDLLGPAAEQQRMVAGARPGAVEGLLMIFRRQYRGRTVLALFVLGMVQLCGIDGVLYYAPTLFAQAGLPPQTASFLASGLSAILMLLITLPAVLYGDRIPRRLSIITGGILLTTCMTLIGILYASNSVTTTSPARWVVIILVFVFGLAYVSTWGIVSKIYASEIQPPLTRSSANSVAQGLGFFTNWVVAIATPVLLAESRYGAYFLFAGATAMTVAVLAYWMPETRGLSLEDVEEAFAAMRPMGGRVGRVGSVVRRWMGRKGVGESVVVRSGTGSEEGVGPGSGGSGGNGNGNGSGSESFEMSGGILEGEGVSTSALEAGPRAVRVEGL
ncbi:hypothetical protein M8818_003330 [Zalaria obscura]|uniref:Uncharacterized protein n=1 Tax=Zalaria obscura TaxID=2024903 RepID=A0ACC3SFP9_9PEZI